MTITFTPDDLVRYLYKETSEKENKEISQALLFDAELLEMFKQLTSIKRELNYIVKTPSDRVVNNILQYSKSLQVHFL
ncbi:MAG: hypothetical protein M3512_16145 [Bacteroidota bacterium]|nr:hypothetical protein [Bacteroidota bacterium]